MEVCRVPNRTPNLHSPLQTLETLVQELKAKKSEIEVAELTGQTYEHMRKRLMVCMFPSMGGVGRL